MLAFTEDPDEPLLRLNVLAARLPGPVLDRLSLIIAPGEFLALLGAAGAGKSRLIGLIAGFERPASGAILLEGRGITAFPPQRRGLGVILSRDLLFPNLTVAGNVGFPLAQRRLKRAERRAKLAILLERFDLAALADRRPQELSPPERMRAALARALALDPPLLLADDPFSQLDPAERDRARWALRALAKERGMGVFFATSEPGEALALADRVAVLDRGGIAQVGPPAMIYAAPETLAVARLSGEANLLPGRVLAVAEDIARVRLDCGPEVEATAGVGYAPGRRCILFLRPERIAIAAASAEDLGENAISARIKAAALFGTEIRYEIMLGEGGRMTVRRPAVAGALAPGRQVALAWNPEHARLF